MIKRTLITLALGMASSSFAAVAALPSDRQYDSIVTLQTGSSSDDLNAILQALGKSVGLTVVTQDIPAKGVNFDVSGKPFRDVWGLLLQVNDLDYELLPNGMVLVGPTAVVAKVRPPAPVAQPDSGPTPVREVYVVNGDPEKLSAYLRAEFPKVLVNAVGKNLTVTATPSEQALVKQLLSRVDLSIEGVSTKSFSVAGNAQELAKVLGTELSGTRVSVVGSVILVTGTEAQQKQAESILAAIDKKADVPVAESVERRFYTVNGDPTQILTLLIKELPGLVVNIIPAGQGQTGGNKVTPPTLSITGTVQQHGEVKRILAAVDRSPEQVTSVSAERRFYETNGAVEEVANLLIKELPGLSANIIIVSKNKKADADANGTISVMATSQQHEEVKRILAAVDPASVKQKQFFEIRSNAADMVKTLMEQIPGLVVEATGKDGQLLAVQGTTRQLEQATALIETSKSVFVQRTFVLQKAKAANVQSLLSQVQEKDSVTISNNVGNSNTDKTVDKGDVASVLNASTTAAPGTSPTSTNNANGGSSTSNSLSAPVGGQTLDSVTSNSTTKSGEEVKVQIIADERTNTIILRGYQDKVDQLSDLIPVFDKEALFNDNVEIQKTLVLSNAKVGDVKVALEAANAKSVPSVQIISDVRTNTLVLRGIKASVDRLAELALPLDKKSPVVNVQVRIQEVSETGVRSLGLDWTAGVGNFVTKLFGGSLTAVFDATQSMVGFNIGASLTASEQQGLSKRVDEVNLMIESSNEERITTAIPKLVSGGKLRVNLPGTGGSAPIQQELDYGVIVEIPKLFVDGDGLVHLKLNAKVTNFSTPPTDPTFINATNREAQTTMTLKPGQTVLLGGLLTAQERNSSTGIPFLSSIPIIGNFFKKSETNNEKTQLMLVVTANPVE